MPELPEVETVRAALEPVLKDAKIASVTLRRPDLRIPIPNDFKTQVEGAHVLATRRRGKYLLIDLSNAITIILHLGMSGRILILSADDSAAYEYAKHDHVIFECDHGAKIVFNDARRFGFVTYTNTQEAEQTPPFDKMAPEPPGHDGGHEFNGPVLAARLKNKISPIKTALLDQRIVSGLGNIYVCEALHQSGISPFKKAGEIKAAKLEELVSAIKDVLRRAIAAGGSSLKDYKQADGSLGYFQHGFAVYDRAGQACSDCNCNITRTGGIKREVQAGRSTFYCPQKQK
jgi:formamidopyrimidine-DNA glycosylase